MRYCFYSAWFHNSRCLSHSPTQCCLQCISAYVPSRGITADLGKSGRKLCWFLLWSCTEIPKCIWPQSLGLPQCLSQCILLISRISPHFQHLSSSQDLKCLLSGKASSSRIHPGSYSPSSIHPFSPCPSFPNLNRLCGEVQCPISLIIVNSVPRLFI